MNFENLMSEKHFIAAIVVWLLVVPLKSFIHFYIIHVQKIDPHKSGQIKVLNWILTSMASIAHAMIFNVTVFAHYLVILFFQLMWHQIIFAPFKNKLRKLNYFYLGLESGGFDKFFVQNPRYYKIIYAVYCLCALLSIYMLNIIFRR